MKYDDIDKKLIEELIEDGRISYVDLAAKVGLSRVAVKERLNHVVDAGIIGRFIAVINSEKVGKQVSAFLDVDVKPNKLKEVAQNLADNIHVASIYQMTGPSTLHMHVLVRDFHDLEIF